MAKVSPTVRKRRLVKKIASRTNEVDSHLPPNESSGDDESIQIQLNQEYTLAWAFMKPKIEKWLIRLKLYNNQRRDDEKVGDPLLYTVFQTVLASLIGDKLAVNFKGREEGDEDKAQALNSLAEMDYEEMEKAQLDYDWNWDAGFFGRGLCLMNDFDTDSKTPVPEILDPTTFLRNPGAKSINGNRSGKGKMLFGGYEIRMTKADLEENEGAASEGKYYNLDKILRTTDIYSLTGDTLRQRNEAQGRNDLSTFDNSLTENFEYSILRWFTHIGGEKYIVEAANNRTLIIRKKKVDKDYWPIIDRAFSPISHDWDGVSIPDLVEDKQRFKASLLNTSGDVAKASVNGMTLFHEDRFRKTQDFNFKFGKWIPVKGTGALADAAMPLKTQDVSGTVKYILDYLDLAAQKATATPEIQQGGQAKGDPTKGELDLQASKVDTRYSLTAKIFGWSEKKFWKFWYYNYIENFEGLGEKIARIEGPFGPKWQGIDWEGIKCGHSLGPDIEVESKQVSEARKLRTFQTMQGFVTIVAADPASNADKIYLYRKLGRQILPKDEVERIIPLTIDEYQALEENKKLNDEELPKVTIEQNHEVHLRVHASADDNPYTRRHIQIHIFMLMQKRQFPGSFPNLDPQAVQNAQLQNAQPGTGGGAPAPSPTPIARPPEGAGAPQETMAQ